MQQSNNETIYINGIMRLFLMILDLFFLYIMSGVFVFVVNAVFTEPSVTAETKQSINYKLQHGITKDITAAEMEYIKKSSIHTIIISITIAILSVVYLSFCCTKFGTTPAKFIGGAKIIDQKTMQPPSFRKAVLRYTIASLLSLPMGLTFCSMFFSKHKQTLHDKLTGTVIIRSEHNKT